MRRMSRWIPLVGLVAAGVIVLIVVTTQNRTRTVTTTVVQTASGTSEPTAFSKSGNGESINQIYQQDGPGVVDILVKAKSTGSSGGGLFGSGSGSQYSEGEGAGVVYNDKGYILTDEHVIDNAVQVVVTFENGKKVAAKVIGSDASSDVGVIKVDVPSSELHPIKFANSDNARVGDPVVAIGSPFSQAETVTSGIVSQTGRVIQAPTTPPYSIPDAIQTDAAINPGNSGGPLLDAAGDVLGLNDQIDTNSSSATGQGQNAGIGFATPSNEDQQVANQLIAGKTVQHAFIGLELAPAQQLTTSNASSAVVKTVQSAGPAAKAGVQVNDVVTKLDSTPVATTDGLISLLARYMPGTTVTLTVDRSGQTKQIKVTLGNRPKAVGSGG